MGIDSYETAQRKRTLTVILWATFAASLTLSVISFSFGQIRPGWIIVSVNLVSVIALYLNTKGHYYIAAVLASTLMLFALIFDLYEQGSIHDDMGIVGFPVIIAASSLLFGKKGIYVFSSLSIFSVLVLGYLEINKIISPSLYLVTDAGDLATVTVFIVCTAVLVWIIIENAEKNLQRIKKHENDLRISYELTLEGLTKALEFRDRETEGHSRRVIELSVRLGEALGLDRKDIVTIRRGALLHDIGKLAIPDTILLKPGPLTGKERAVMRQHPIYSMEILANIPFLEPCMSIPYCHHERWDGTGYPQGLKGYEIPLFARIFTIVDQWEALNSDRPYRKAWRREDVLKYITENRGKIYDPHITDIFLSLIDYEKPPESSQ